MRRKGGWWCWLWRSLEEMGSSDPPPSYSYQEGVWFPPPSYSCHEGVWWPRSWKSWVVRHQAPSFLYPRWLFNLLTHSDFIYCLIFYLIWLIWQNEQMFTLIFVTSHDCFQTANQLLGRGGDRRPFVILLVCSLVLILVLVLVCSRCNEDYDYNPFNTLVLIIVGWWPVMVLLHQIFLSNVFHLKVSIFCL